MNIEFISVNKKFLESIINKKVTLKETTHWAVSYGFRSFRSIFDLLTAIAHRFSKALNNKISTND